MHACDGQTEGQTDGQTEFSSLDRDCIACSAVKIVQLERRVNWYCGRGLEKTKENTHNTNMFRLVSKVGEIKSFGLVMRIY